LSCWHRGHVMPEPPSGRGGEGSEAWAEINRPDLHGQEHGRTGHAWGRVARCSPRRQRRHSDRATPSSGQAGC